MEIKIEARHIACGELCVSDACPVALALREYTDEFRLSVGAQSIRHSGGNYWGTQNEVCVLPPQVEEFVRAFDDEQPVVPFSFRLSAEVFMK